MKYCILTLTILNSLALIFLYRKKNQNNPQLCLFTIINKFKIKISAMQLETQAFVNSILGLIDKKTGEAVPATFSNVVLTSSDTTIFTADTDVNVDGQIDVVGVAEGEGTLNVKADATYINSLGDEVTTPEEANVTVTITAAPAGANDTELVVTFSAPQKV